MALLLKQSLRQTETHMFYQYNRLTEKIDVTFLRKVTVQLSAFMGGEALTRVTRIIATIAIARVLAPEFWGIAAMAIATSEIIKTAASGGIGPYIVAVSEKHLAATLETAKKIIWILCSILTALQLAVGWVLSLYTDTPIIFDLMAALSTIYLIMAPGLIPCFLIMRAGQLTKTAQIAATQMVLDNILTIVLITIWPNIWAIVLPKIIVAPVWLILTIKYAPTTPKTDSQTFNAVGSQTQNASFREIIKHGTHVLISDLAIAAKTQGDKIILGLFLGSHALGIYIFAFNTGLGIALAITNAYALISYSHLCNAQDISVEFRKCLALGLAIIIPFVLVQLIASPYYIPYIFGLKWEEAIPVLSILALAAIPRIAASITSITLRASSKAGIEAKWATGSTIAVLMAIAAASLNGSPVTAAWAYVAATYITDVSFLAAYNARSPILNRGQSYD